MVDSIASIASIVASSLKRSPPNYSPPLWRWILVPASVLLQRHYGGVWFSGDIHLTSDEVRFVPNKLSSKFHSGSVAWSIPLGDIFEINQQRGMAMDTIDIHHPGGIQTFKSVGSAEFVAKLRRAASSASD